MAPIPSSRQNTRARPWGRVNLLALFKAGARVVIISTIAILILIAIAASVWQSWRPNHFVYLANALNHASFATDNLPSDYPDQVTWNGHIYIPLGPMPGVLLMPWVGLFGLGLQEIWVSGAFTVVNCLLLSVLLKRLGIADRDKRLWLCGLFFLGTVYLTTLAIGRSWYLAHISATMFLLLGINEGLGMKRAWLIGLWLGCAFLTRASLLFALPFFLWALWPTEHEPTRRLTHGLRTLAELLAGLSLPLFFYGWYNYARFGSALETGYGHAILGAPVLAEALRYGLFSPVHIPKNLYVLLLAPPQPVPGLDAPVLEFPYLRPSMWGMGLFFTTPAFAYAFRVNWRDSLVRMAGLTVLFLLIPLLTYYGIGFSQFGYRYALDFYPFLFILTALGISPHFNRWAKMWIVVSILINVWGAWWTV